MKKRLILGFMLALLACAVIISCKDKFTEQDALNAQQTVELSVYVYDASAGAIPNAYVTILRNGKADSLMTDSKGYATFTNVDIGTNMPLVVRATGYTVSKSTISTTVGDYRQKLISQPVPLMALTGPSTAQIRGKVEIETDLTNTTSERAPAGTVVTATMGLGDFSEMSISTTVDASGNYTLTVPTTKAGQTYRLIFPDLELDQKIAMNGLLTDGSFPTVLPTIGTVKTVFSTTTSALSIPVVKPVYATIAAPPAGATAKTAIAGTVSTLSDGTISSINVADVGANYAASSTIPVTITSLLTGSGATATATASGGSVSFISITGAGSGYPIPSITNANRTAATGPSFSINPVVKSGDIKVVNVNYGTGSARNKDIK